MDWVLVGTGVSVTLYLTLGLLAALGSVGLSQWLFKGQGERIFYGAFLIVIAGFYAAFVAHYQDGPSWPIELQAIALFAVLGLVGMFQTKVLAIGYVLHGCWDIVHELNQQAGVALLESTALTTVPDFYGFLCLAFDMGMAVYFLKWTPHWQQPDTAN